MATKTKEPGLQEALIEIGREVGTVAKDGAVAFGNTKFKYASAENVLRQVREACHKHGVAIVGSTASTVETASGSRITTLGQTYAKGDETATFHGTGEGKDSSDKGTMKANTAALKYLLANAFNISWGDDPEATDENGKSTAPGSAKRAAGPKPTKGATPSGTDHAAAIAAMTKDTAESVRAAIKADSSLDNDQFNALVAAFKAKQATL